MPKQLNEKDISLIERFLDFDLSESELTSFEKRMDEDSNFQQHVNDFEKANYISELIVEEKVLPEEIIESIEKKGNYKKILFALAIIVLVLFCLYIFIPTSIDEKEVYANVEDYVIQLSEDAMRGHQIEDTIPFNETQQVIQKITKLNEIENPIEAIPQIKKMLDDSKNLDAKEIMSWWLVKFHMENGDIDSAAKALGDISNNSEYNSSYKAKEILKGM